MTDDDALWRTWRARWERFQDAYVPQREQQFALFAEYISLARPEGPVRLLDACSGPGSVAEHVLERLPCAEIVAVDIDPWLLELGRRTSAAAERIRWVDADLRDGEWLSALPRSDFDGVLCATAMHWLQRDEIERLYGELASILVPGGVLLIADVAATGTPGVQRLARTASERRRNSATARPGADDWPGFWQDARRVPEFRQLLVERDRRLGPPRPFLSKPFSFQERALQQAGFRELGEVWRRHDSAVVIALR